VGSSSKEAEMAGQWKGIVGKGFTPPQFEAYVAGLSFSTWRPQFVVLHNTAAPTLAQWHSISGEQRMRNLSDFYQNVQKWSAGPHLFVADDLIWVFTPLTLAGVHSPSWNTIAWGVEMVGDYNAEPFADAVRDNVVSALTTLHDVLGLDPASLKLHKEDPRTTHDCPGRNVSKADIIARVQDALSARAQGEHSPAAGVHEVVVRLPA
jgi:hypothetical protein